MQFINADQGGFSSMDFFWQNLHDQQLMSSAIHAECTSLERRNLRNLIWKTHQSRVWKTTILNYWVEIRLFHRFSKNSVNFRFSIMFSTKSTIKVLDWHKKICGFDCSTFPKFTDWHVTVHSLESNAKLRHVIAVATLTKQQIKSHHF